MYTNPSRATIPLSLIRPHQCDSEGGRRGSIHKRGSTVIIIFDTVLGRNEILNTKDKDKIR